MAVDAMGVRYLTRSINSKFVWSKHEHRPDVVSGGGRISVRMNALSVPASFAITPRNISERLEMQGRDRCDGVRCRGKR